MAKRKLQSVGTPCSESSCLSECVQPEADEMRRRLKQTLGAEDFVELVGEGKRRRYAISCPVDGCSYKGQNLGKHLANKVHGWPAKEVTLTTSFIVRQFNYLTKKKTCHKPKLCSACSRFFDRLDNHLATTHKIERSSEKHAKLMTVLTEKSDQFLRQFKARNKAQCKCSKEHVFFLEQRSCKSSACPQTHTCPCYALTAEDIGVESNCSLRAASADHSLSTFKSWLMKYKNLSDANATQVSNHVQGIWSVLDESMSVACNKMRDVQRLEDVYFNPILDTIAEQQLLPVHMQRIHTQPATVRTKLGSLKRFLLFVQTRKVNVGLMTADIVDLQLKCNEMMGRLKPYEQQRQQDLATIKASELLSPELCEAYGTSPHIQYLVATLEDLSASGKCVKVTIRLAVAARNYFMAMLCVVNAPRSSNIISITLYDVYNAKTNAEYSNARIMRNPRYKTSMLYGEKILVLSDVTYGHLITYIEKLRPLLVNDSDARNEFRYLFHSSRSLKESTVEAMKQSLVSNGLTATFKEALSDRVPSNFRVSPTKIRISIATELVGLGDENLKTLAESFMKNKESTTRKFYVQHWANRESLRLSMKCMDHFKMNKHEEAIILQRKKIDRRISTDRTAVETWYGKLKEKILEFSGEKIEDDLEFARQLLPPTAATDLRVDTQLASERKDGDSGHSPSENNDWFVSRGNNRLPRDLIMLILCLFEDVVKGQSEVNKVSFYMKLGNVSDRLQEDQIKKLNDWPRVREMLKSMRRKFKQDSSNEKFEDFVLQSRFHWHAI